MRVHALENELRLLDAAIELGRVAATIANPFIQELAAAAVMAAAEAVDTARARLPHAGAAAHALEGSSRLRCVASDDRQPSAFGLATGLRTRRARSES
jgi:hypothetical protein